MENTNKTSNDSVNPLDLKQYKLAISVKECMRFIFTAFLFFVVCCYKYLTTGAWLPSLMELLLLIIGVSLSEISGTLYKHFLLYSVYSEIHCASLQVQAGFYSMIAVIIGKLDSILSEKVNKSAK